MCGPVIAVWTVKYEWTRNNIVAGLSSMSGPVITVWTVKYVWTSNYSVDSHVCVDQ